jgi:hypothetical protein
VDQIDTAEIGGAIRSDVLESDTVESVARLFHGCDRADLLTAGWESDLPIDASPIVGEEHGGPYSETLRAACAVPAGRTPEIDAVDEHGSSIRSLEAGCHAKQR